MHNQRTVVVGIKSEKTGFAEGGRRSLGCRSGLINRALLVGVLAVLTTSAWAQFDGGVGAVQNGSSTSSRSSFDGGVPASGGYRQGCIGHDISIRGSFRFAPQGVYRRVVCTGDFAVTLEPRLMSSGRLVLAEVTAVNPTTLDMTLEVKADNNPQSHQYVGQPFTRNLRASAPDLRFSRDFGGDYWGGEIVPPYLEQNRNMNFPELFERVKVKQCPLDFSNVRRANLHSRQVDSIERGDGEEWRGGCLYRSEYYESNFLAVYLFRDAAVLVMKFHSPIQEESGNFYASLCLYRTPSGDHGFAQCDDLESDPNLASGHEDRMRGNGNFNYRVGCANAFAEPGLHVLREAPVRSSDAARVCYDACRGEPRCTAFEARALWRNSSENTTRLAAGSSQRFQCRLFSIEGSSIDPAVRGIPQIDQTSSMSEVGCFYDRISRPQSGSQASVGPSPSPEGSARSNSRPSSETTAGSSQQGAAQRQGPTVVAGSSASAASSSSSSSSSVAPSGVTTVPQAVSPYQTALRTFWQRFGLDFYTRSQRDGRRFRSRLRLREGYLFRDSPTIGDEVSSLGQRALRSQGAEALRDCVRACATLATCTHFSVHFDPVGSQCRLFRSASLSFDGIPVEDHTTGVQGLFNPMGGSP